MKSPNSTIFAALVATLLLVDVVVAHEEAQERKASPSEEQQPEGARKLFSGYGNFVGGPWANPFGGLFGSPPVAPSGGSSGATFGAPSSSSFGYCDLGMFAEYITFDNLDSSDDGDVYIGGNVLSSVYDGDRQYLIKLSGQTGKLEWAWEGPYWGEFWSSYTRQLKWYDAHFINEWPYHYDLEKQKKEDAKEHAENGMLEEYDDDGDWRVEQDTTGTTVRLGANNHD